ncbi:hypothetical protein [Staphylococcus xylosus]|uniref:hypothetical protein n=1 Tax=Staphylococcus xylosus TaxID=1288 RepID=UPI000D1D5920|nr:hypothetical protein [Staphylococcus xylosus]PTI64191.1 hypothetical protein BU095_06235 [Staphylococcus xylosus]
MKPIEKIMTLKATVDVEFKMTLTGNTQTDFYDLAESKADEVTEIFNEHPHKLAFEDIDFKDISNVEVRYYE